MSYKTETSRREFFLYSGRLIFLNLLVTVSIYIFLICFALMGTTMLAADNNKVASSILRRPVPETVSVVYRRRIETIISKEATAESNRHVTFLNHTQPYQ